MKRLLLILLFSAFFTLPLKSPASAHAGHDQPLLENIIFDSSGGDQEQISFKLNGAHIPKIFALDGKEPKVVFDFPDTKTSDLINQIIKTNGKFIKRIRIGLHEGPNPKTRVVFDLRPNKKIDFEQQFDNASNTLVITVFHAGSQPAEPKNSTRETAVAEPEKKPSAETPILDKQAQWEEELKAKEGIVKEPKKEVIVKQETPPVEEPPVVTPPKEEVIAPAPPPPATVVAEKKMEKAAPPTPAEKPLKTKSPQTDLAQPTLSDNLGREPLQAGKAPVLHSIEFDDTSSRGEMVLFQLNDFYPPIVFGIEEGSPRVVCDFMNTKMSKGVKRLIESKGQFVQNIRTADHKDPDKIRTVIDLAPKNNYDLQQVFFKEENLFILIVNTIKDTKEGK